MPSPRSLFVLSLWLGACAAESPRPGPRAAAPPGASAAAVDATAPGEVVAADAPDASAREPAPVDAPPGVSPELVRAIEAYLAAANTGDHTAQQAGSTDDCWWKECGSFARQAGKKFRAERRPTLRRHEKHALAVVDILCDGSRKCDLVYLLFELTPSLIWVVADVTEDGKKADAWVTPPGYVEPKMPPNVPPGAPRPAQLPGSAPATLPKGTASIGYLDKDATAPTNSARVVAGLRAGFRACYVAALALDAQAAGELKIEIEFAPSGDVADASAKPLSGTLPAAMVECVVRRVRVAKFDPPLSDDATLRFPVTFSPAVGGKK
ncbi:MAG: hypothetical protein IT377_26960 [Polyangiaceae bacterium]|nr:hypothetical protein [Polyangiaceae bacterium]